MSALEHIEDFYPLTPMQRGMLFHTLLASESEVYVEQFSCRLRGQLDVRAFEDAWNIVVMRHAVLRTGFQGERLKEPVQIVHRTVPVVVQYRDWVGRYDGRWEQPLQHFLEEDRDQQIALATPPLLRLSLIRLEKELHQFVWSYHHALLDGWSVPIVLHEVLSVYESRTKSRELRLPQPRAFRDYVLWLRKRGEGEAEAFWRRTLGDFSAPTLLPFGPEADSRFAVGFTPQEREIIIPSEITSAL